MKEKTIIVDIDNTLVPFGEILHQKQIDKYGKSFHELLNWDIEWDSWKILLTKSQFYDIINEIHSEQYIYKPYTESKWFLSSLKSLGFYIIIASHRLDKHEEAAKKLLKINELYYDELHLSTDKTILFDRAKYIVDDCPNTLVKAKEKGLIALSLEYSYNRGLYVPLFNSLTDIFNYIKRRF